MAFQILSLSGGGFMGLYTAAVLASLEEQQDCRIADCFDLIAGTSVGGIIALGLAHRTPASEIRDAFLSNGASIFSTKPPPQNGLAKKAALFKNATKPLYSAAPLARTIEAIVGSDTLVRHLNHRVMVPTVNLTKGSPQVFKTSHHPTFSRDLRLRVVDVALATSAAPTFFPLHRIGGELYADGGLYANAPDHLALHEAEHFLGQNLADIRMLSIGTTTSSFSFSNSVGTDLGWMGWMEDQRLPNVMIAANQVNADFMLRHRLGERYLRIDHTQSREQEKSLALDVASDAAKLDLLALAEASVREHLGRPALSTFLKHTAPTPTFFNLG
ncbi:CBASS cGAMP-activated phospholipase [Brevundimonas sp. BR2-1]|uniref:CBASS cGAMP-activated phospholipase n=1 Tax=Brevundimonas sp. BR2-1 TaxID=3031123 RepID=UPI0030A71B43